MSPKSFSQKRDIGIDVNLNQISIYCRRSQTNSSHGAKKLSHVIPTRISTGTKCFWSAAVSTCTPSPDPLHTSVAKGSRTDTDRRKKCPREGIGVRVTDGFGNGFQCEVSPGEKRHRSVHSQLADLSHGRAAVPLQTEPVTISLADPKSACEELCCPRLFETGIHFAPKLIEASKPLFGGVLAATEVEFAPQQTRRTFGVVKRQLLGR